MISIYDTDSLTIALAQPMQTDLRGQIERHIDLARQNGLAADATHLLVIEPGDTERGAHAAVLRTTRLGGLVIRSPATKCRPYRCCRKTP